MYILDQAKKEDPVIRWNLPDRIFFGHGACHILAGVYLTEHINSAFRPFWIRPYRSPGMHIFVSDGEIAFDYHGYSILTRLEKHHREGWKSQYPQWTAETISVDFDLLCTDELNKRNMRGPDQYLDDAARRARKFINRIDHGKAIKTVRELLVT